MADTPAQASLRAAFDSKLSVIPQTLSSEQQTQAQTNMGGPFLPLTGGTVSGTITATGFSGPLTGNASTASAWSTARSISISGDATGSASVDGSEDATINITLSDGAVTFENVNSDAIATQAEAEAGTANDCFMTPLSVAQAIAAQSNDGGSLPMGHLFAWPFQTPPDGCIQCIGTTYSRSLYADFWSYISSKGWVKTDAEWQSIAAANGGYCPWYSDGDGSTTFRTPKFAPFMQIAISSGNVGDYHEAGLPNITASWNSAQYSGGWSSSGAVYGVLNNSQEYNSSSQGMRAYFDASRSNAIYGGATTVQPESTEWMICVVVLGKVTNIGSVDISEVMSAVAQFQVELNQISTNPVLNASAYVTETWRSGANWYRVWSDGFVEQGGFSNSPYGQIITVTLIKPLTTTNYTILLGGVGGSESSVRVQPDNQTTTSFQTQRYYSGNGQGSGSLYWEALGY